MGCFQTRGPGPTRRGRALVTGYVGKQRACDMIDIQNLTVSYRGHPALHHISGEFRSGSLSAVIGPNGAGKSTLLKTIVGLLKPAGGHLDVRTPRKRIAYLPQQADLDRGFPMSVRDCVLLGGWSQLGAWKGAGGDQLTEAQAAIHAVGLDGFEHRTIGSLSRGQFQRALFARLMVQQADLILLDEPFTAMDTRTTEALLDIVAKWHIQGRTIIAVLHDDEQVRRHFPQTVMLARELVAWGPTSEVLRPQHLQQARSLAEAWDDHAEICHTDEVTATSAA